MFNCKILIFSFTPIEIVFQRDLRWWTRRQILPFIQFFSIFQSFSFHNAICWKCSLKDDCVRSCLIELQSFSDAKINIDPIYRILMSLPCILQSIVRDVVQSSRYALDLCGLLFLDQWARRTQIVFCSNSDLQVSIHC